jgi:hypothetical protein
MSSIFLLLALVLVLAAAGSIILVTLRLGIPPMPSSMAIRSAVVQAVRREQPVDTMTDLGSGWGGLARTLARQFPESSVVGVEHSPFPLLFSVILNRLDTLANLRFRRQRIERYRLRSEQLYVCYLARDAMVALRRRIEHQVPRDITLVSCHFAMPGWTPSRVLYAADVYRTPIYVYRRPCP